MPEDSSSGEINRVVQDVKEEVEIRALTPLPRLRFLHSLPSCFPCSAERIEVRFSIERGQPLTENAHVKRRFLILSSDFVSSSLVNIRLQGPKSASGRIHPIKLICYLFVFVVHLLPFRSQQLSNLTYTWYKVICDQHKEVKSDRTKNEARIPKPASGFSFLILSLQS
jgi:hypothetical protein